MAAQRKIQKSKLLGRIASGGFALASACYALNGWAAGYAVLEPSSWVAADVLRFLMLRTDWNSLVPYLCRGSNLVQHILRFTTCS